MEITLGDKIYTQEKKPKARMVREALEISEKMQNLTPKVLDGLIDYVVKLYGKQFTRDDIYDQLDADQLVPTLTKCIEEIVGLMGAKLKKVPNKTAE